MNLIYSNLLYFKVLNLIQSKLHFLNTFFAVSKWKLWKNTLKSVYNYTINTTENVDKIVLLPFIFRYKLLLQLIKCLNNAFIKQNKLLCLKRNTFLDNLIARRATLTGVFIARDNFQWLLAIRPALISDTEYLNIWTIINFNFI